MTGTLLLLPLLLGSHPTQAAGPTTGPDDPRVTSSRSAIKAFADSLLPAEMADRGVPGAAFVFVRDGEILVLEGYGMADVSNGEPVRPDSTVFRFGSLSKLVTATAVMQLADRGRLDLRADVNRYLERFQIPDGFPEPVTAAALLTHTSGIDDHLFGQYARSEETFLSLGRYLEAHEWHRWMPPGEVVMYSDHGMALAGYLVEAITGRRFADYVRDEIFRPLEMESSTFEQPPPPGIRRRLATGYAREEGGHRSYPYALIHTVPSVAFQGSAADLGRFLLAHLEGEREAGSPVLSPAAMRELHRIQFRHHPGLRGRAFGFAELRLGSHRALYHDGSTSGFTSRLVLLPELNAGFALTYNHEFYGPGGSARAGGRLKSAFTAEFTRRFLRDTTAGARAGSCPDGSLTPSGTFRELTLSPFTLEKVALLMRERRVRRAGECRIEVGQVPYVRIDSLLYGWPDDTRHRVAFGADSRGRPDRLYVGNAAYRRIPWYRSAPVHAGAAGIFALLFLAMAVSAPVCWHRTRRAGRVEPDGLRVARWTGATVGTLDLAFLTGVGFVLTGTELNQLFYGPPPLLRGLLVLPLITGPLAAFTLWVTWRSRRDRSAGLWERRLLVAGGLAGLLFLLLLGHWQLLGFQF